MPGRAAPTTEVTEIVFWYHLNSALGEAALTRKRILLLNCEDHKVALVLLSIKLSFLRSYVVGKIGLIMKMFEVA